MGVKDGLLPLLAGLALLGLSCASTPDPAPEGPELDEAALVRTLRERTRKVRSLYAVLTIAYEGERFDGVFDAVARYEAPGRLRLTAFKDLLLVSEPIFDLVLTPDRYAITIEAVGDNPAVRDAGPVSELAEKHRGFGGFERAREAIFLPGAIGEGAPATVVERAWRKWRLRTRLPAGREVAWTLDPVTAVVTRGEVGESGGSVVLDYAEPREAGETGVAIPRRVTYAEAAVGTRLVVDVVELEVNVELEPDAFALPPG